MAEKNIKITIAAKRAAVEGTPVIVCGNSDYTLTFTFDEEWGTSGYKTARFVYMKAGEWKHEDKIFNGNTVPVPVLSDVAFVLVGVYEGDLSTTTPARVPCVPSILCGSGEKYEPTPEVYDQIMTAINDLVESDEAILKKLDGIEAGAGIAEVEDIRNGYDGQTYDTAGDAVRAQVEALAKDDYNMQQDIESIGKTADEALGGVQVIGEQVEALEGRLDSEIISNEQYTDWVSGVIDGNTGDLVESTGCATSGFIHLPKGSSIVMTWCTDYSKLSVYAYESDSQEYIGKVAVLTSYTYESASTYTAPKDIQVRCSTGEHDSINFNVKIIELGLKDQVELLEDTAAQQAENLANQVGELAASLEETDYQVDELDTRTLQHSVYLDELMGTEKTKEVTDWVDLAGVDSSTGELITDYGYVCRTSGLINLPAGSVLAVDGDEEAAVRVYSYDVETQAFKGLLRNVSSGKSFTATEDLLVRCYDDSSQATVYVTAVTGGRVDTLEDKVEALENKTDEKGATFVELFSSSTGASTGTMNDDAANYNLLLVSYEAQYNGNWTYGDALVWNPAGHTYDYRPATDSDTGEALVISSDFAFSGKTFTATATADSTNGEQVSYYDGAAVVKKIYGIKF